MQGGKNWFFPKEMKANRFFWDSHWLEIWSNHFCPSMGRNGGIVAIDLGVTPTDTHHHPFSQLILGQIFNEDVTVYSPPWLFKSLQ
jgi:hypothetical protein